ncbi:MAG: SDR family NAD(P)-dependent oxidoreductase [Ferruginibacter sp.]|nr:SDR family NAD(P)-dependent oxidoreductase [Cytophagales bacterium]
MKRTILISGSAGNLGQAVTGRFLRDGYQVVALSQLGHPEQAHSLRQLFNHHPDLDVRELDALNEKSARAFVDSLSGKYPTVEAAALLVGSFAMGGVAETDEALLDRMISLNFKSAYLLAQPLFGQMKQQGGGRLVLVGARTAVEANSGRGVLAYSISKAMVVKLADLLNVEGKAHNVITSVVVPDIIDTPPNRADMPGANFDVWVKPEEIAEVIAFACSPAADRLDEPVYKIYGHQ